MEMKNGRCDTESLYLNAFVVHKDVPLTLDYMFEVLVSCNIVRANKLIYKLQWLELHVDQGAFR